MSSKVKMSLASFKDYFLDNYCNDNIFNEDGSLNKNYNSFKKTGVIASIFEDHWHSVYSKFKSVIDKFRPNANIEVNKIIDCSNKDLGVSLYECPNCHDLVFIGHTCKSRFCSSCGYKYKNDRVESILQTAYKCPHRHLVFTIPKELRKFFFFPFKKRMNILFKAVNLTINSLLNSSFKKNKSGKIKMYSSKIKFSCGFFAFLHTFGRDLKFNPHIHVLIAEIKLANNICKKWNYFNFDSLSKRFQKILLDLLSNDIGKDFNKIKNASYLNHPKGFYVYAEAKKFNSLKDGIEYVTRYCGRVPISENRIVSYDGLNVTFSYIDHYDNQYKQITISASKFILILLRHLIPSQFKIIRYYGFYRKKHPFHDKMVLLIDKTKHSLRKQLLSYKISILSSFHRNPYNCPKCNTKMKFVLEIT